MPSGLAAESMLRVGLTGGIGSGKSTVAAFFAQHGVPVIDTDIIAHNLVSPGQPAHTEIIAAFGHDMHDAKGRIDRPKLRKRVFANPKDRTRLEAILHPRIRTEVIRQIQMLKTDYCLIVVPLLFEAGFQDLVDRVLVVDAEDALRIARATGHGGFTEDEIRAIMAAQASREDRLKKADDVVANNSDLAHLQHEVDSLHKHYVALATTSPVR